jgi:hypothetical protein
LEKLAGIVAKWVWARKVADGNPASDNLAKAISRKPGVQVKSRRFDFERRRHASVEVKRNGVIRRRTNRAAGQLQSPGIQFASMMSAAPTNSATKRFAGAK